MVRVTSHAIKVVCVHALENYGRFYSFLLAPSSGLMIWRVECLLLEPGSVPFFQCHQSRTECLVLRDFLFNFFTLKK